MADARKPDAVLVPDSMRQGDRSYHRIDSILRVAEPILGLDPSAGRPGHMRAVQSIAPPDGGFYYLCTGNATGDTLLFPKGHPREGQQRYRWEDAGPLKLGYLVEEATLGAS